MRCERALQVVLRPRSLMCELRIDFPAVAVVRASAYPTDTPSLLRGERPAIALGELFDPLLCRTPLLHVVLGSLDPADLLALGWQEGHTVAEGMEQLGLSRSTCLRRLKAIRERADERDRVNAERARDGEGRHLPPVTLRLVDTR